MLISTIMVSSNGKRKNILLECFCNVLVNGELFYPIPMHRWDCTRTFLVMVGCRRSRQSLDAEERQFHHQPCSIIGLDSPEDWMMP